jgi:hypothetical protein
MPRLTKAVNIEVLSADNKKVIRRFRFTAPDDPKKGKQRLTPAGVDKVLENFIESFDRDNPDHKYRLVDLHGGRFRLVHEFVKCKTFECHEAALSDELCRKCLKAELKKKQAEPAA